MELADLDRAIDAETGGDVDAVDYRQGAVVRGSGVGDEAGAAAEVEHF